MRNPPRYEFVLIDMEGSVHTFILTDRVEAMNAWDADIADKDIRFIHGFLYVEPTGGFGRQDKHLLHSF